VKFRGGGGVRRRGIVKGTDIGPIVREKLKRKVDGGENQEPSCIFPNCERPKTGVVEEETWVALRSIKMGLAGKGGICGGGSPRRVHGAPAPGSILPSGKGR